VTAVRVISESISRPSEFRGRDLSLEEEVSSETLAVRTKARNLKAYLSKMSLSLVSAVSAVEIANGTSEILGSSVPKSIKVSAIVKAFVVLRDAMLAFYAPST